MGYTYGSSKSLSTVLRLEMTFFVALPTDSSPADADSDVIGASSVCNQNMRRCYKNRWSKFCQVIHFRLYRRNQLELPDDECVRIVGFA